MFVPLKLLPSPYWAVYITGIQTGSVNSTVDYTELNESGFTNEIVVESVPAMFDTASQFIYLPDAYGY